MNQEAGENGSRYLTELRHAAESCDFANIGRVSLARENEAGGSWGQEIHILDVNI